MQQPQELRTIVDCLEAQEKRLGTIAEATSELNALMKAVRTTGKGGTVTIKIKIEKDKNDEEALTWLADVSASIPKPDRRKGLIYHDAETQTFSRTDPRQMELLREQEQERADREAELREAGIARIGRGADVLSGTAG